MNLAISPCPGLALAPAAYAAGPRSSASAPQAAGRLRVAYLGAGSDEGQDGVARSLDEMVRGVYGSQVEQSRVDLAGSGVGKLLRGAARLRRHGSPVWRALYRLTDFRPVVRACAALLRPLMLPPLRARLPAAPDLLVAVHCGAAQCLRALADSYAVRPRTAVVVTDYDAHRAWFAPADHYVVTSPMAAERAQAAGIPSSAITVHALLPCRRPSGGPLPQHDGARRRLRVVAVAGNDGSSVEKLEALLRRLDQGPAGAALRVDVVCGHARALHGAMLDLAARLCQIELRVHGYVADLPALFASADLALLRASPQALTEAVTAGTPVLAFDWRGHEAPHARLLSRLGCGLGSRDTETVAQALEGAAADRRKLAQWAQAARNAAAGAPGSDFIKGLFGHLALPTGPQ